MINNRQGGRRRGRGGGTGRAPNMNPGAGNRQDNRQRGNAAQLLEKYKGLARDAQMQGDRVITETYLQFADHYFRVLNESRARFDEQRRQRGENGYDGSDDDEDQDEVENARDPRDRNDQDYSDDRESEVRREPRRQEAGEDRPRRQSTDEDRPRRQSADEDRPRRQSSEEDRPRRPVSDRQVSDEERPRRSAAEDDRPRRPRTRRPEPESRSEPDSERIAADILPPAISASSGAGNDDQAPAPRRRVRRPRDPDDIAPAA